MKTPPCRFSRILAGLFVAAACLLFVTGVRAVTAPAKIAYIEGVVLVKRAGASKPEPAELGMSLFYGDQVKTLGGKCQINMTASGILRLSPNTTVLFPSEENKGDKISVMRMLEGKTRRNLGRLYEEVSVEVAVFWMNREIAQVRAEGNALLDSIRADLQAREGKAIDWPCPSPGCGAHGPHRWTPDGWECACGTTVLRLSDFPTPHGAYSAVRAKYQQRIQKLEEAAKRKADTVGADFEVRFPSLVTSRQG